MKLLSGVALVGALLSTLASTSRAAPLEKRVSGVPGFDICKSRTTSPRPATPATTR